MQFKKNSFLFSFLIFYLTFNLTLSIEDSLFPLNLRSRQVNFLGAAAAPHKWNFTNCGKITDSLQIKVVTLNCTPVRSQEFQISMTGIVTSHQDLKQVIATTSYDKSVLNSELVPKTDVLDANDSFAFAYSPTLPSFFPTGNYTINFIVQNVNQETVCCTSITFII